MSRSLSFGLTFAREGGSGPVIRLRTRPDHSAAEMAPDVPASSVLPALAVFAAIDGTPSPAPAEPIDGSNFIFRLSSAVASSPWRAAMLLNLIDNAVFGSDDPASSSLIESVTFESDDLALHTLETLQAALDARKEEARGIMTGILPPDFETHPDLGREWPADGIEWFFKVEMKTETRLTQAQQDDCRVLVKHVDSMLAWTAFETDKSPAEVLEAGIVPYPVEVTVSASSLTYQLEMPPSGTAMPLVMMRDILEKRWSAKVSAWTIEIAEGW
jgi:hypothetical protein